MRWWSRSWLLDAGCWLSAFGCWLLAAAGWKLYNHQFLPV
jgi:hypothetical protein